MTALANGHGSGSVATEDLSAASSQAGSLVNLSPVPSQSIDAKPFIPGHAEIRCAHHRASLMDCPCTVGSVSLLNIMWEAFSRHMCNITAQGLSMLGVFA